MTFAAISFPGISFQDFLALICQSSTALASAACALARSIEPIETISMEPRTFSEGSVIIVGDAAISREAETLDRLLVGDDIICAGGQQPLDAADPKRML